MKRQHTAFIQVSQYYFSDSANFQCDILHDTSSITEDIESYSHLVVLLFMPYRCNDDLKLNDKYTYFLRHAIQTNTIIPIYKSFYC